MTEPATVQAAERRLRAVVGRLASARALERQLIEERRELWRYLVGHGVSKPACARMAGVTPNAVGEALEREP